MHQKIIQNYNAVVQPDDIVFFLGDIGFGKFEDMKKIFQGLRGTKVLILGNHDKWGITSYYRLGFSVVLNTCDITMGKRTVKLNHVPQRSFFELLRLFRLYTIKMWKNGTIKHLFNRLKKEWSNYPAFQDGWTLCGHVHQAWKIHNKNINVGVDVWGFKPVHQKEIFGIMDREDK
jgi:calcineurin-like phosphoesterase family protein